MRTMLETEELDWARYIDFSCYMKKCRFFFGPEEKIKMFTGNWQNMRLQRN